VVDVGCGLAHLSSALSARGLRVVAVEANAKLCQGAAGKLKGGDSIVVPSRLSEDASELPEEVGQYLRDSGPSSWSGCTVAVTWGPPSRGSLPETRGPVQLYWPLAAITR
jgi:hypothetical protein